MHPICGMSAHVLLVRESLFGVHASNVPLQVVLVLVLQD
jgi:hypothetical protein